MSTGMGSTLEIGNSLTEGFNALVSIDLQQLNSTESVAAIATMSQIGTSVFAAATSSSSPFTSMVSSAVGGQAAIFALVAAGSQFETARAAYQSNPNEANLNALMVSTAGLIAAGGGALSTLPIPQIRLAGFAIQFAAIGAQNALNGNLGNLGEKLGSQIYDLLHPTPITDIKNNFHTAETIPSPIVLDLNGDGVKTTALTYGAYFDHAADGFAEQTGWASPDDGLLVRDLNGNGTIDTGRELFGSETLLADGSNAANGFVALAELDTNSDGKIDGTDTAYTTLKIWKDTNGDGYTSTGELLSLTDAGVQSINTGYTASTLIDANSNEHRQTGTFTTTAGQTQAAEDIWFKVDPIHTIATDWLPETAAVAALPDLQEFGNVYDLHQAILRNRGSALKGLVQSFLAECRVSVRNALFKQIHFQMDWQ